MFPGPWGFPFHMGGSQGEGRRRRRRSSDSSRSRDRRRRSARGRSRRSRSPARSERSQPQTAPLPPPPNVISLPQPQAGYVWQQVPAVPQMMTAAPAPKAIVPSSFQQSWDQKGSRSSGWHSQPRQTKPWNKYYGKHAWGAGQTDRYDVKEATPAEITAANKRKSEGKSDVQGAEKTDPAADPDDEEYLRTLWTSAKEAAHGDPSRPKSAAELVAAGELRPWWTYSWKQVSEMFPQTSDYKECLQSACGDIPPLVVNRLATLLAAFRHYQRPLEGTSPLSERFGPEVVRFDIPGQHVVAATCHMPFPEYQASSEYAHFGTFSHGTSWTAGAGIAEKGGLTVGHSQADHFPCFGFSARGSLTAFSRDSMISAVTKTATRSKSLGGIIVVTEATLPGPTPNIEGGGEYMHATCRDSGSVRSGDHFLISPRYAVLKGVAVSWPK